MRAVELLTRVGELVPTAKRILLVERGDWSSAHPVVSAMALGQVDYHLYNPWHPLERILYPAVSEFLAAWDKSQDAPMVPVRIVGTRSATRSHELRDTLTRVGVPFWFYEPDTPTGEELLAEAGVDASQLPVVVFFDGTVLDDPPFAEVWSALGVRTQVDVDSCDVVVIGGGPAGLAAAVYASSEGLETLVLEPAVPGGQARDEFVDPQLSWLPPRERRRRSRQPSRRAGVVVRHQVRALTGGHQRRGSRPGPAGAHERRPRGPGARGGHRDRGVVAPSGRTCTRGAGRLRSLLRRRRGRSAGDAGARRVRGGRRQLGRAGRYAPVQVRRIGDDGGSR